MVNFASVTAVLREGRTAVVALVICATCKRTYSLEVPIENWRLWQCGALIQTALPSLSPGERELLITGMCDACWQQLFSTGGG